MGRLIDADLLKKNCKCTGTFESNFQCVSLKTLGEVIDAQPTAYDPDKVVEQLENERKFWENAYDSNLGKEKARSYEHAIQIVKGGGVNGN
nr:MAG TPA: hypothetical protein [Bacteriophage sp.]